MATEVTIQLTDEQEAWLLNRKSVGSLYGSMSRDILSVVAYALPEPVYRVELIGTVEQFDKARIRLGGSPFLLPLTSQLARVLSESPAEWEDRRVHRS